MTTEKMGAPAARPGTTAGHDSIFAKPQKVTDLEIAFPASVERLMPQYKDIPEEFRRGRTKWTEFQRDWFFHGLKSFEPTPKEGIDPKEAFRHLSAIQGSFEPKHEHKEAAVAYLASLWFEDAKWQRADSK